jgi:hypothetical protein
VSGGQAYAGFNANPGGTVSSPNVIENCVAVTVSNSVYGIEAYSNAGTATHIRVTNSTVVGSAGKGVNLNANAARDVNATLDNVLVLTTASSTYGELGAGTVNVTGSNNFGGSADPFPVPIQGSPYPITPTTSFSTPLGSGDYAVYMGATGALADVTGNDVWQQGVGPSVNSDVPTTDINGVARSGATCNPGAFEADGFVAPTVLTRTIGSGKDYATFTIAEADVTNIGGSADLTFENEAIVFEADAGTYTTGSTLNIGASTLVTDATRNVTYTKAAGPVEYVYTGGGSAINIFDAYTVWRGIDITYSGSEGFRVVAQSGYPAGVPGVTIQNVTVAPAVSGGVSFGIEKINTSYPCGTAAEPIRILNCVSRGLIAVSGYFPLTGHTTGAHILVVNCTHLGDGVGANNVWNWFYPSGAPDASFKIINCANLANTASNDANILGGGVDVSGSGYNVGNSAAPTSSFRFENIAGGIGSQYTPTTDLDPGPGDWAIYDAATGALIDDPDNDVLAGGIGPDANPDVPTTDIIGNPRTGLTTEPGAFVLPPPPVVEEDTWTPVMVRRNDPVDVYGVLTFGDAYINAVEDTLSVTGADGTDATPAIPVGTRALWIQLVSQTGAAAGETCDVSIEVSASQSLTLATLNGAGTAVGNVPGLMQFPVDCLGQNDPDTPVYPRVKMVTGSTVGASDVVTIRVVAICGQQTNTTWS